MQCTYLVAGTKYFVWTLIGNYTACEAGVGCSAALLLRYNMKANDIRATQTALLQTFI